MVRFHKKGVVFSISAILIVLFFAFVFSTLMQEYIYTSDTQFETKASAISSYQNRLLSYYLPITLRHQTRLVLFSFLEFIEEEQLFLDESTFHESFISMLKNGTFEYQRNGINYTWTGLDNRTFQHWIDNFSFIDDSSNTLSRNLGLFVSGDDVLRIDPIYEDFIIEHDTPWSVVITGFFNFSFNSEDFSVDMPQRRVRTRLSILDFYDPLYLFHGNMSVVIDNTTDIFNIWNISRLNQSVYSYNFFANERSPSYLMRFYNNTNPHKFGIVSFIDPNLLNATGPLHSFAADANVRSFVDYRFFEVSNCFFADDPRGYLYNILYLNDRHLPHGFRLDYYSTLTYLGDDFNSAHFIKSCGDGES